ncbi:MAG: hypothetical protein LH615_04170 [Ferruginibacter sp.]|nr:hypothetical protein [Ferruginibacter sp.]
MSKPVKTPERTTIFDARSEQKIKGEKALLVAKKLEQIKIKGGYKYVTSHDGKTAKLVKL